jgi:hypothetical protein
MDTREQYAQFLLPVVARGVEPVVVVSASGRTLTGDDGRTYLDCFSGISVVNAGHGHPRILAAAREQMERLVHCCSYVYHVRSREGTRGGGGEGLRRLDRPDVSARQPPAGQKLTFTTTPFSKTTCTMLSVLPVMASTDGLS